MINIWKHTYMMTCSWYDVFCRWNVTYFDYTANTAAERYSQG